MSKSTGAKGSDNNSKGDNSSDKGSSDSESKGSTSSGNTGRGGNSGDAGRGSESKGSDAKGSESDAKGSESSQDSAQSDAGPSGIQTGAAREAMQREAERSADTYGSFVQGVMDAAPGAPVRDAIGVSTTGEYGTVKGANELANDMSYASHQQLASDAWNDGSYGSWATNKLGGLVDSVQSYGYTQARELSQAPLDKIADLARNPAAKGAAMLLGGPAGLAVTGAIGLADTVADYVQGEKTGKQAGFQGLGDLVGTFGPPQAQLAYTAVTDPAKAAKQFVGGAIPVDNPIIGTALRKGFGYGIDKVAEGIKNGPTDTGISNAAFGEGLLASRGNADRAWSTRTSTTGSGVMPTVMNSDAMTLHWKMLAEQEAKKPKYNTSMMFLMS